MQRSDVFKEATALAEGTTYVSKVGLIEKHFDVGKAMKKLWKCDETMKINQ